MKTTKMIIKKLTGVRFSPEEFRSLSQCLRCGKACNTVSEYGICESCEKENIDSCSVCGILLRNGSHKFYTYDIKENHRSEDEGFKVSKEYIREFTYESFYTNPKNPDGICSDCIDYKTRIKNRCVGCGNVIKNDSENYKDNGNYCGYCSNNCEIKENEEETGNN